MSAGSISHQPRVPQVKQVKAEKIVPQDTYTMPDCDYHETKSGVTVEARRITQRECKKKFGHNIIHSGQQPIQIYVNNNSPETVVWRPSYTNLPLVSNKKVSKGLKRNTPVWVAAIAFPIYWLVNAYVGLMAIPVTAYYLSSKNKKKKKIIHHKSLNYDTVSIPPYTQMDKYFFIERSRLGKHFEFKLFVPDLKKLLSYSIEF